MTLETMLTLYNALSASHSYILGFVVHTILYYVTMDFETLARFARLDRMSEKRGGLAKVRIRLTSAQKAELLTIATACGTALDLEKDSRYNKGDNFERVIAERLTKEPWIKNSVPFNVGGDITINGENIQVKFDGCEITNEKLLRRLTASA